MRHGNMGRKLGRDLSHRKAMMRNLTTALFMHGRIRTTAMRAKELSRVADQVITLAKRGDLHARRQAFGMVYDKAVVSRVFGSVSAWYASRHGGYTRILRLAPRPGDNAEMAYIELVDVDRAKLGPIKEEAKPKKAFKKKAKPTEAPKEAKKAPQAPKAGKAPKAAKPKPKAGGEGKA